MEAEGPMEGSILYFEKAGEGNTDAVIEAAVREILAKPR